MKIWAILRRDEKVARDTVVLVEEKSRDNAIEHAVEAACEALDLPRPLLLPKHKHEFSQFHRTVFLPDMFVESISYDAFELAEIVERKKESIV